MPPWIHVQHPLVEHHLARLRDRRTTPAEFRQLVQRLAVLVAFETTRDLQLGSLSIETPLVPMQARQLAQRIGLVPILRAGLGLVEPVLNLLPEAEVYHLGFYRDEATATPVEYYRNLSKRRPVDVAIVLDPMLATGGSAGLAIEALLQWGAGQVKLLSIIAAQDGLDAVAARFPNVRVYVAAIDPQLNAHKFIVPGLGDAGDRIFNT